MAISALSLVFCCQIYGGNWEVHMMRLRANEIQYGEGSAKLDFWINQPCNNCDKIHD